MATAAITNTFVNATVADADEVNANFADLVSFLNNSVVHRDGSKSLTDAISGVTPTLASHLATKGYVDGYVAAGGVSRGGSFSVAGASVGSFTHVAVNTSDFDPDGLASLPNNSFLVPGSMGGRLGLIVGQCEFPDESRDYRELVVSEGGTRVASTVKVGGESSVPVPDTTLQVVWVGVLSGATHYRLGANCQNQGGSSSFNVADAQMRILVF